MLFVDPCLWAISIHPTLSAPVALAPIPVNAPAEKAPVTYLNFKKPVDGIACPATVGADARLGHTPRR